MRYQFTIALVLLVCTIGQCQNKNLKQEPSKQEKIFEEFWHLMNNHYAFFELRGVDWKYQYDKYRNQVSASTSDGQLFQVLYAMIDPLKDGHTSITYKGTKHRSGGRTALWGQSGTVKNIVRKNYLHNQFKERASGIISFGWLNSDTGYIGITAMEGYDPGEIDPVLGELVNAKNIIVDVRFNGGGYDNTALRITDRFADQRRLAYSKETFYKGSMNEHKDLYVEPHGNKPFGGNLYLLTNRATFSAAEMFVMAMTTLPNCTVIGDNTAGAHSDVMQETLSNGWRVGLSNQVYTMPDGKVYEMIGIPPDVRVDERYEDGKDTILDYALSLTKDKK